jgi:hypothetical protein
MLHVVVVGCGVSQRDPWCGWILLSQPNDVKFVLGSILLHVINPSFALQPFGTVSFPMTLSWSHHGAIWYGFTCYQIKGSEYNNNKKLAIATS